MRSKTEITPFLSAWYFVQLLFRHFPCIQENQNETIWAGQKHTTDLNYYFFFIQ